MFEDHKRRGKARLSRSAHASFSRSYKLVVVQGYVKAASYVAVTASGSGQLSVEFEVPSLNWFRQDQWSSYTPLKVSIYPKPGRRPMGFGDEGFNDISQMFSFGLSTVPAASQGDVTFGANPSGRWDAPACHGDALVVRTMNSQVNEHGRGLQVSDTLFWHTITMGPNLPLLGNLGIWFKELPFQEHLFQGCLYKRAMKLCKRGVRLLRGADEGSKDDDTRGSMDWLMKDSH